MMFPMKKVLRIVLLTGLVANSTACLAHTPLELLDLVEDKSKTTSKLEQEFFEELTKELSQDDASYDLIQNYWQNKNQDKTIKAAVKIIQNNQKVLQKYLQTFPTLELRNDGLDQETKMVVAKILDKLLNNQTIGKKIANIVSQNLIAVNSEFAKKVLAKYPNTADGFLNGNQNLKKTPYWLIKIIFNNATGTTKIKLAVMLKKMKVKGGLFRNFIKQKAGYFALKQFPEAFPGQTQAITQSENHFQACKKTVKNNFSQHLRKNKEARKVFKQIQDKEKEEHEKGRYTFVHAQKWKWNFLAEFFKLLWEIKYDEQIDDYQFLRFLPKKHNAKQEKKKRKNALNGSDNGGYGWGNNGQEAERLFMNHAIFANSGNQGRCSAWYWLRNHDQSNPNIKVYDLLKALDLEHLYRKYKTKFQKLEKLHEESSKYGNILLLSFDQTQLKECVIPAGGGGNRNSAYINGGYTYDVKKIVDALRNNPSSVQAPNSVMYCTVLTQDYALDPHKGPRIYAFNHTEEKKYEEYKKLWEEIKQNLAKEDLTKKKNIITLQGDSLLKKKILFGVGAALAISGALLLNQVKGKSKTATS